MVDSILLVAGLQSVKLVSVNFQVRPYAAPALGFRV